MVKQPPTTSITLEMPGSYLKGQALETFKFSTHRGKVNQRLKSQTPPYLPNGDSVSKFFYIIGFKTLENGGVGHLQIFKK